MSEKTKAWIEGLTTGIDGEARRVSAEVEDAVVSHGQGDVDPSEENTNTDPQPQGPYRGHVDGIFGGDIAGWAINISNSDEHVVVQLKEGDALLAEQLADVDRHDLIHAGFSDSRHGFSVSAPASLNDGQVHEITVLVAANGQVLTGAPVEYQFIPATASNLQRTDDASGVVQGEVDPEEFPGTGDGTMPAYIGYVDGIAGDHVHGWVVNTNIPGERVLVRLMAGERILGTWSSDVPRDDLARKGYADSLHGFAIPLPDDIRDGLLHALTVVIDDNDQVLEGPSLGYEGVKPGASLLTDVSYSSESPATVDDSNHMTGAAVHIQNGPGGADDEISIEGEPGAGLHLQFRGYVDGIIDGQIAGWVVNVSNPGEHVVVQLKEGEVLLVEQSANVERHDLVPAGLLDPWHGFSVSVPQSVRDGQFHLLTVTVAANGQVLSGAPVEYQSVPEPSVTMSRSGHEPASAPSNVDIEGLAKNANVKSHSYLGHVDGIRGNLIWGWVVNPEDHETSVLVQLREGATIVAEAVADIYRDDLEREGYSNAAHGFEIGIPDTLRDAHARDFLVVVAETGQLIDGSPISFVSASLAEVPVPVTYEGYVDGIADDHVHGWVINTTEPGERVSVQLMAGEKILGTWLADVPRDDLARAGYGDPLHGFAIPLPAETMDGALHTLAVVITSSGQVLEGGTLQYANTIPAIPCSDERKGVRAAPIGQVDHIDGDIISGWCAFQDRPDYSAVLELRLKNQVVASTVANVERNDLTAIGFENTNHGFSISVPKLLHNGSLYSISLVEASTGEVIDGGSIEFLAERNLVNSKFEGNLERIDGLNIVGWAFDANEPDRPVELYVTVDGIAKQMVLADRPRSDVAFAGKGSGSSGFEASLPECVLDGSEHQVAVVFAETGTFLKGSPITVSLPREGTAFVNRTNATIDGWARNTSQVVVQFDNGEDFIAAFDRPVAGLLSQDTPGFRVPIPRALLDNAWHRADVNYSSDGSSLDGSPILFRLGQPATVLDYITLSGRRVMGRVCDSVDPSKPVILSVEVGGEAFATVTADKWRALEAPLESERLPREFSFILPSDAKQFALRRVDSHETELLGTWRVETNFHAERPSVTIATELSQETIEAPVTVTAVREALDRFFSDPSDKFDELWYLTNYWHVSAEIAQGTYSSALDHYRKAGAPSGYSPSAYFDEAAVRAACPPIVHAIRSGKLPSAFGLHLYLCEAGTLGVLPGMLYPVGASKYSETAEENSLVHLRRTGLSRLPPQGIPALPADEFHIAVLPRRMDERESSDCIYAAWYRRLTLTPTIKATLNSQEAAMRNFVASTALKCLPLVSIIMPTFNRAYTIAEAIQSVLDQGYQNWELLICDDASTDRTSFVVAQFADTRIRYMQFEKTNGAATRNKGLRYAKGDYIAYLDSDNLWDPLFLDIMIRSIVAAPGHLFAYSGYLDTEIVGSRVNFENLSLPEFNGVQLSNRNFIDLNTIMHHRRLYDWLGGFDEQLERLQDWDLVLRFTSIFNPVFVPYCLAFYRRNLAWGQVTHLFLESNMQSTVARKTHERLEYSHSRLQVAWPMRPKLAVILSGGMSEIQASLAFANLASPYSDITFVSSDAIEIPELTRFRVWTMPVSLFSDPTHLVYALSLIPDCVAVVSFGGEHARLRRLSREIIPPLFRGTVQSDGLYLRNIERSHWSFHLGALPLQGEGGADEWVPAEADAIVGTLFSLPGQPAAARLTGLGIDGKFELLLAPADPFDSCWAIFRNGVVEPLPFTGAQALGIARRHSKFIVCGTSLGELSIAAQSLLFECMGASLPTLLVPDSYGLQLIDSNAAYPIDVPEYAWILDKLPKLFNSKGLLEKLCKNGRRSYLARMHPELVQERIVSFIYQIAFCENSEGVAHVA